MRFLKVSIVFGLTVSWIAAFLVLSWQANDPIHWASLITIATGTIVGGIYGFQAFRQQQYFQKKLKLVQGATSTLSSHMEMVIFDEGGRTLWATHPNTYPHLDEFVRKMLLRVESSPQVTQFKQLIQAKKHGKILMFGGGNGLKQQQKWWLVHSMPIDLSLNLDQRYLMVMMSDLSPYLENYHHLKQSYLNLEDFIDQAPFGLYYKNKQNICVGANATLSRWLGIPREELIGKHLDVFMRKTADNITMLMPRQGEPIKAVEFFPQDTAITRSRGIMVCRFDQLAADSEHPQGSYDLAYSEAPIPAAILNNERQVISCNPAFVTLMEEGMVLERGVSPAGKNFLDLIHSGLHSEISTKLRHAFDSSSILLPFEIRFKEDKIYTTTYLSRLNSAKNRHSYLLLQFVDISEQKRLESQFIQSQKMQAVGQLAGGIAHDFNNLLTAMIGFCDLLLQRYLPNNPSYSDIMQIKQNAHRAANLVRQLLAFSRRQTLQPKVINITDTLAELSALLRRLIGAGIELKMEHDRDLWLVKVDVSQLEQVIINLVVNARDAMSEGGILTIRTSNYHSRRLQRVGHDVMPKGEYILIEVSDTGHGIEGENLDRIFEPFFSTKEMGSGTGLGLSTVYGIVKQTGGFVLAESEVRKGATFKIFLPAHGGEELSQLVSHDQHLVDLTGGGTILLVEDEDAVRMFSARALREKGYKVIEASSGEAALETVRQGKKFDLLITDVVMPKMDGPTLSKKMRDILPETKTIFISGYTEDTFRKNLDHNTKIHFLQKPFTLKELASKVKEVLTPGAESES